MLVERLKENAKAVENRTDVQAVRDEARCHDAPSIERPRSGSRSQSRRFLGSVQWTGTATPHKYPILAGFGQVVAENPKLLDPRTPWASAIEGRERLEALAMLRL